MELYQYLHTGTIMSDKCYLAEASSINNSFNLKGSSIRCYEVTLQQQASQWGGTSTVPIPTGVMYQYKDGEIVQSKTKASLANKYLGYRATSPASTIDKHSSYSCTTYTTPELAILAQLYSIHKDRKALLKHLEEGRAKLDSYQHYSDAFIKLAENYPELLI